MDLVEKLKNFNQYGKLALKHLYGSLDSNIGFDISPDLSPDLNTIVKDNKPILQYIIVFNDNINNPNILNQLINKLGMIIPPLIKNKLDYIAKNISHYNYVLTRNPNVDINKLNPSFFSSITYEEKMRYMSNFTDDELIKHFNIYVPYISRNSLLQLYGYYIADVFKFYVKLNQSYNPLIISYGHYDKNVSLTIKELISYILNLSQDVTEKGLTFPRFDKVIPFYRRDVSGLNILLETFKNKDSKGVNELMAILAKVFP